MIILNAPIVSLNVKDKVWDMELHNREIIRINTKTGEKEVAVYTAIMAGGAPIRFYATEFLDNLLDGYLGFTVKIVWVEKVTTKSGNSFNVYSVIAESKKETEKERYDNIGYSEHEPEADTSF